MFETCLSEIFTSENVKNVSDQENGFKSITKLLCALQLLMQIHWLKLSSPGLDKEKFVVRARFPSSIVYPFNRSSER